MSLFLWWNCESGTKCVFECLLSSTSSKLLCCQPTENVSVDRYLCQVSRIVNELRSSERKSPKAPTPSSLFLEIVRPLSPSSLSSIGVDLNIPRMRGCVTRVPKLPHARNRSTSTRGILNLSPPFTYDSRCEQKYTCTNSVVQTFRRCFGIPIRNVGQVERVM